MTHHAIGTSCKPNCNTQWLWLGRFNNILLAFSYQQNLQQSHFKIKVNLRARMALDKNTIHTCDRKQHKIFILTLPVLRTMSIDLCLINQRWLWSELVCISRSEFANKWTALWALTRNRSLAIGMVRWTLRFVDVRKRLTDFEMDSFTHWPDWWLFPLEQGVCIGACNITFSNQTNW